jgi:NADH:ubiquinone oxidoreductase subunit K
MEQISLNSSTLAFSIRFVEELTTKNVEQLTTWLIIMYALFLTGLFGMLHNYKNFIITMMCVEIMYLGAVSSFVFYGLTFQAPQAAVYGLLVLIFGACESAIGLGLLVAVFRFAHTVELDAFTIVGG